MMVLHHHDIITATNERKQCLITGDLNCNYLKSNDHVDIKDIFTTNGDVLPSPSNLRRWRICSEASCFLCHKEVCTTAHILGACKKALSQGRFTFRHDSVLKDLVEQIKSFLSDLPLTASKKVNKISFVKAGNCIAKSDKKPTGLLHLTSDWVLLSDLGNNYVFPGHIAISALRPDIVLFSNALKRAILIELTCPCEENMESWHSDKLIRYSGLFR